MSTLARNHARWACASCPSCRLKTSKFAFQVCIEVPEWLNLSYLASYLVDYSVTNCPSLDSTVFDRMILPYGSRTVKVSKAHFCAWTSISLIGMRLPVCETFYVNFLTPPASQATKSALALLKPDFALSPSQRYTASSGAPISNT